MKTSRAHLLFLPLFFASGFAALVYQMVWQRLLTFFSGADVFSVTIIVSAFMAGLGLGNLVGGHLADRITPRRRILAFALAEAAITAFALISIWLLYDVLFLRLGSRALPAPVVGLVLFVVLLWPTFFMGLSLPLLARVLTDRVSNSARRIGGLYGWNTLGAALGSLVSVWLIVRLWGFAPAVYTAAAMNAACAASALLLLRLTRDGETQVLDDAPPKPPEAATFILPFRAWLALYALSGFIALSLEIVWFRLLGTIHKPSSFTFATLLALYLLGVGGGALVGGRIAARARRPAAAFFGLQAGIALYASLSLAVLVALVDRVDVLRPLWQYLGEYETLALPDAVAATLRFVSRLGEVPPYAREMTARFALLYLLVPLFLIGPPTVLMGLSFAYLQRTVQTDLAGLGRRVGWLQTANIAGSTLGAALTGLVLLHRLGTPGTLRLLSVLAATFVVLWGRARFAGGARAIAGTVGLALVAAVVLWMPQPALLWARLHGTSPDRILHAEDGSGLSVLKDEDADGQRTTVVYVDGLGQSDLPYHGYHVLLGALPVLVHPRPVRVAIIGLGSGATLFGISARRETLHIDCIEIVASQMTALRALEAQGRYPALSDLLGDPRVRYAFADGRSFLMRSGERYDVIETDALRPGTPYVGNLYSVEFFELLRERLAPGGLAVTWAPTERVRGSFLRAFPHVLKVGETLLGSGQAIPFDGTAVRARMQDPYARGHFERGGVSPDVLLQDILRASREATGPGYDRRGLTDLNRDLHPKDEYLTSRRFLPRSPRSASPPNTPPLPDSGE